MPVRVFEGEVRNSNAVRMVAINHRKVPLSVPLSLKVYVKYCPATGMSLSPSLYYHDIDME